MEKIKKGLEKGIISMIIISFILVTTATISNSPYFFTKFICWLGQCEGN